MNLYETLYLLQFIILIILLLVKLFNIMSMGKLYSWKGSVLTYIGALICWLVGMSIFLLHPEILIYLVMQRLLTAFLPLHTLFFIIELLLMFKDLGKPILAYKPSR